MLDKIWHRIQIRCGGGLTRDLLTSFKQYILHRDVYNKFALEICMRAYFLGTARYKPDELLKKYFLHGDYYDFGIMRIPAVNQSEQEFILFYEFLDLIFPYLISWKPEVILNEGAYEDFGVRVDERDIVIDLGANIGMFTGFALWKGAQKVYAFEPVPYVLDYLKQTVEVNDYGNKVEIIPWAVMDKRGEIDICIDEENFGGSSCILARKKNKKVKTKAVTLDEFVGENNIDRIDFIKADIEGAERYMLMGAKNVLREFKPKLALCTYHLPDDREVMTDLILEANPSYNIKYSKFKLYAI